MSIYSDQYLQTLHGQLCNHKIIE